MNKIQHKNNRIKVALADDHVLLRNALAELINSFDGFIVVHQSGDGKALADYIKTGAPVDVILLDLNMPGMNGYETAGWLRLNYPQIHVLMLTMYDSELVLIRLLQQGVKGFLKKDIRPAELKSAIESVISSGFYYSHHTSGKLAGLFRNHEDHPGGLQRVLLDEMEIEFLKYTCTDKTYKEIALTLKLNPRSVDNLRDKLFEKLDVRSRVGLAMYAIRNGIVGF